MLKPTVIIQLLLLALLLGHTSRAAAINLSGNWAYREAGGDNIETRSDFSQSYSLGVGPALSYKPSHALSASASVGYTRRESDTGNGFITNETYTPTASISLQNDIFLAQLAGNTSSTIPETGTGSSRTAWDAALLSTWSVPYFPILRFSYSEQGENNESSDFLAESLSLDKNLGAAMNWDLYLADLSYVYSQTQSENRRSSGSAEGESHFARFETDGDFWDKRIGFTFAQQVQAAEQTSYRGQVLGIGVSSYASPTGPDSIGVGDNIDANDLVMDLGPLPQSINLDEYVYLKLTADNEFADSIIISFDSTDGADLKDWSIYKQSGSDNELILVDSSLQSVDIGLGDDGNQEIRIDVTPSSLQDSGFDKFFLVAKNETAAILKIIGVQGLNQNGTVTRYDTFRYLTNFTTRYRISRTVSAAAGMTLDHNESESDFAISETDKFSTNGTLRWRPTDYFSASLGVSEFRQTTKTTLDVETPDLLDRNYSLIFSTVPLPVMHVSFGVRMNERFVGSEKTSTTTRYSIGSKAQIYPDLTAGLSLSYGDQERLISEEDDAEVLQYSTRNTFSSRLDLNAKLFEKLNGALNINYSQSQEEDDNNKSGTIDLELRSRLSELLAVRAGYETDYIGIATDKFNASMDLRVLNTDKTRLTMTANHTQADSMSQNVAMVGNWLINRNMSLVGRAAYRFADSGDSYNFRLSLSFSI